MPSPTYWFEKIHDAIDNRKGDHAVVIANHGAYLDDLLDYYKDSLSEDSFSDAKGIVEQLREYYTRNLKRKYLTVGHARNLVSELQATLGYGHGH